MRHCHVAGHCWLGVQLIAAVAAAPAAAAVCPRLLRRLPLQQNFIVVLIVIFYCRACCYTVVLRFGPSLPTSDAGSADGAPLQLTAPPSAEGDCKLPLIRILAWVS
jgi:hypothetical protein